MGGIYTTVEGLLNKIHTSLTENNPFAVGDATVLNHSNEASVKEAKTRFVEFMGQLLEYARGEKFPFTLILRDPLGNSFVSAPLGSSLAPEEDPNLTLTDFERSYDENEEFGLNDINTKDYETGVKYEEFTKPDRLTHVVPKGADHPTFFAKGVDDNTSGGGVFLSTPSYSQEAGLVDTAHGDDGVEFEPSDHWQGSKDGFVFRLGAKGLGYYKDFYFYKADN